ncbi:MAG: hypothetical protein HOE90_23800 [Bacteriovoracaceae bacterium]|nr:hypothetical protein [Bacteriovoracaceae bacterium]
MKLSSLKKMLVFSLLLSSVAFADPSTYVTHYVYCEAPSFIRSYTVGTSIYEANRDINPFFWAGDFVGISNHSKHYLIYGGYYLCVADELLPGNGLIDAYITEYKFVADTYDRNGRSDSIEKQAKEILRRTSDRLEIYDDSLKEEEKEANALVKSIEKSEAALREQKEFFDSIVSGDDIMASYEADVDTLTKDTYEAELAVVQATYEASLEESILSEKESIDDSLAELLVSKREAEAKMTSAQEKRKELYEAFGDYEGHWGSGSWLK